MALFSIEAFLALLLLLLHSFSLVFAVEESKLETYIVHVEPLDTGSEKLESWYHSFLATTTATSSLDHSPRMVYTYKNVIKGFAARLTPSEVEIIRKHDRFLDARPQRNLPLHTTHSPSFLGLNHNSGFWKESNYGEGVIIGILDTGVLPDHPSFSDEGMPPPPTKWKGKCEFNFTACNNKIIGARYFSFGQETPLDRNGHGTHTASIAAGNFVTGANSFGQGNGTAVGIAPRAHLSIYKVCFDNGPCSESDVLAAMDAAIEDGVDVLSLSLGWSSAPFSFDAVALGAYSAVKRGIFVSCSAMNNGPSHSTLSNEAPWILTVGASTIDRKLKAVAVFGNKEVFHGETVIQPKNFSENPLPLIYPGKNSANPDAEFCISGSLEGIDARGKLVLCRKGDQETFLARMAEVEEAGAAGVILVNEESHGVTIALNTLSLPTMQVVHTDGLNIKAYANTTSRPTASIFFKGTVIGDDHAPMVAYFSSRGPSLQSPGILKPDIIGPGVNILGAWPMKSVISNIGVSKNTHIRFLFNSGTSMACPHLSGVAALLKSAHPDWSPAAIKSAIMTTADVVNLAHNPIEDETLQPSDLFATGAGHVNPSRANDPGLVYDIQPRDYIPYLCGLQYTDKEIGIITQEKVRCSDISSIDESQLNYPSFSILFGSNSQNYTRTLTNVGEAKSSYMVKISAPTGVDVGVTPNRLDFTEKKQKLVYQVTFTRCPNATNSNFTQGFIAWTSNKHFIRSPIVAIMLD